jgi:CelD/BcsL family acetyltransferase involved in cellulose biosynthesis
VSAAFGFPVRAWLAEDDNGRPLGGVAFCELDDLGGHRLVSLPFSDCGDPLFASPEAWRVLLSRLQSSGIPVHFRCLFADRLPLEDGLSVTGRASWHRLSVSGSEDELWQGIAPAARRAIRRAQRGGVEIRTLEGAADRDAFHRMHVALRKRKYRLLAQPPQFFEAIEDRFQAIGGWHGLAAVLDGRLIAATMYLRWGDVLYYKFNASDESALAARPNSLLVWAGIQLAKRLGCAALDLGPSRTEQPGLIRFKRSFGAEELELRFLRWTPPDWRPQPPGGSAVLRELIDLLTDPAVPDEITARAGAALYRFLA